MATIFGFLFAAACWLTYSLGDLEGPLDVVFVHDPIAPCSLS